MNKDHTKAIPKKRDDRDPVCGKHINRNKAHITVVHEGDEYLLCCPLCQMEFERDPGRYSSPVPANSCLEGAMSLSKRETRDLYRRRAKRYDRSVRIYRLFGFDMKRYRQEAIASLGLCPGDQVVELGCGTGLNFEYVQQAIGAAGKIIGVDLTDAMLEVARERVSRERWTNVELLQADLAHWQFPADVSAVYSTFAITLVPEYEEIIKRASCALRPGGTMAVLDMKEPAYWPTWLVKLAVWLNKPFGVSLDLADRHPWESIRRHLRQVDYKEYYFGAIYLCAGRKNGYLPAEVDPLGPKVAMPAHTPLYECASMAANRSTLSETQSSPSGRKQMYRKVVSLAVAAAH